MLSRFLGVAILLSIVSLLIYSLLLNPGTQASPQELTVITRTRGHEEVKATIVNGEVRFRLKNNHRETITAFAIKIDSTMIRVDFAFSDVHFGIEPEDTFETSYTVSPSPTGELPTLYLLAVLLKNGARDGNSKVAQEIKDVRLGNKIQLLRTLRILEKEGLSWRDLEAIKSEFVAALNTDEAETRISLSELQPNVVSDDKLSDDLRAGLHWGREKMLQRFEEVQQLPTEHREHAFMRLKERSHKLFAKL